MTTGPEHYQQAEDFLGNARSEDYDSERERYYLAAAQVHATLALAAAVGTFGGDEERSREDVAAWERVAGEFTRQNRIRANYEARKQAEEQAAREAEDSGCSCGCADDGAIQNCFCGQDCHCTPDCRICDRSDAESEADR